MLIAGAGDDDAVAVEAAVIAGRLEREGHFRPRSKGSGTAKFDAVFVEDDRAGGQRQASLSRFNGDVLLERTGFNFSCTHTSCGKVAQLPSTSNKC